MNKDDIIKNLKINLCITLIIILTSICIPSVITNGISLPQLTLEPTEQQEVSETNKQNDSNEVSVVKVNGDNNVKVYLENENRVEELSLDEYLYGVVSAEVYPTFNEEALKAQAVAARTFYLSKRDNKCANAKGADICNTVHCQVYNTKEKTLNKWSEGKRDEYWNKIKNAVDSTSGLVITYDGEVIKYPQFFSTSSGKTESCKDVFSNDVPYLVSIESKGDEQSPSYNSSSSFSITDFVNKINSSFTDAKLSTSNLESQINIVSRSEAGGVLTIKLGNKEVKGTELRKILGIKSTNFTYKINGDNIIFDCVGYGHGVGMSQWGANAMAQEGSNFEEILKHYYTGVNISKLEFK